MIKKSVSEMPDSIENVLQRKFKGKTHWINLNGLAQMALLKTIIPDPEFTVYKLKNGQIMYGVSRQDMEPFADRVEELKNELDSMGIDFMYVQIPFKIKDDSYMPPGTHANGNENADDLVSMLKSRGINTLDLRDNMEEQNIDWTSFFFNTDHHWTPQSAFWAAGEIMDRIHKDYGFDYHKEYYDADNYEYTYYRNYMLGSIGRRTGIYYGGLDDFVLFNPKYDTDFSFTAVKRKGKKIRRNGSFWDTMYSWEQLQKRADFTRNNISTYTGRNYAKVKVVNKKSDNGLKILMIRESFTCALLPFIAINADEVTTVDLRRYKKPIPELCKKIKPDLVIVDYNPSAFSKEQFNFLAL